MGISGEAVMAVEWTLFTFAYTLVALRVWARLARQEQKHIIASDAFLIVSALVCLGLVVCDTLTYQLGAMKPETSSASLVTADDLSKQIALNKVSFASNYFYDTGMYFPKATILSLYFQLFPSTMPKLRMALYIVTGFTVSCGLTTCFLDTFYCPRVSDNWSLEEGVCSVFNSLLVLQIDWAMNISTDIFIFILPFPLLRVLQLRRMQRYGLVLTFGLGIVTIAVNLARFITIQVGTNWNGVYVWSMAEMSVAIMVVSLPTLKNFLVYWRKTAKSRSQSGTNSNYNITFDRPQSSQRQEEAFCEPTDDSGSEIELNPVWRAGIVQTKEIRVDSRPAGDDDESNTGTRTWEKIHSGKHDAVGRH